MNGGLLGSVPRGQLYAELEAVAFALPEAALSAPDSGGSRARPRRWQFRLSGRNKSRTENAWQACDAVCRPAWDEYRQTGSVHRYPRTDCRGSTRRYQPVAPSRTHTLRANRFPPSGRFGPASVGFDLGADAFLGFVPGGHLLFPAGEAAQALLKYLAMPCRQVDCRSIRWCASRVLRPPFIWPSSRRKPGPSRRPLPDLPALRRQAAAAG